MLELIRGSGVSVLLLPMRSGVLVLPMISIPKNLITGRLGKVNDELVMAKVVHK